MKGYHGTMRHYLDLVTISGKVHRRQSRMTRICIVLAVFLVSVLFGLADMYLRGMTEQTMHQNGDWHCRFFGIEEETAAKIAARPDTELCGWQGVISQDAGFTWKEQPVSVAGMEEEMFSQICLGSFLSGHFPVSEGEAAVPESLAEEGGLSAGDQITLKSSDGRTAQLTVTGVFSDETAAWVAGNTKTLWVTPESLPRLASNGRPQWQYVVRFSLLADIPSAIEEIEENNSIAKEQVLINQELLSVLGKLPGSNMSQMYSMAFLLSLVVMGTCVMMISSSLGSNISQRTEFFGVLRCLGASRRQILRFVRREALQWCIAAIPMGIGLGLITVWGLCSVMRNLSPVWFGYMPVWGISWPGIGAAAVLGVVTVLLAARAPAKQAARVSPLEAVTGSRRQEAVFRHGADTRFWHVETALGIHHAWAKRRGCLLMTGAFAACITLFLGFCTGVPFMKQAFMPKEWTPELSIVSDTNTCSIPAERRDDVAANPSVRRVFGRMFAYGVPASFGGDTYSSNLISYEAYQFAWTKEELAAGSVDDVARTPGLVLMVSKGDTRVKPGDTITLTIQGRQQSVTVGGILEDSPLAREDDRETLICSEETFTRLTGETGYTILDVQFRLGADSEDAAAVEALFEGGVSFQNQFTQVQQQRRLYYAFSVLIYGFLSVIVAITVFHIMNTINMGAAARARQYGFMRAIGMSGRQLTRMVAAEAAVYAVGGTALGSIGGLGLHWFFYSSLVTRTFGIPWEIPWPELCLIVGIILATAALSVRGPAKRLQEMSIAENISTQ